MLNADFTAVCAISVERAVGLWFEGKVELVEEVPGEALHSPSITIPKPQVVRLKQYHNFRRHSRRLGFSKRRVALRDGHHCCYCHKAVRGSDGTIDHVVPRARGGQTDWDNVVLACRPCNAKKRDRTLEELGWKLAVEPCAPEFSVVGFASIPTDVVERWSGKKPNVFS